MRCRNRRRFARPRRWCSKARSSRHLAATWGTKGFRDSVRVWTTLTARRSILMNRTACLFFGLIFASQAYAELTVATDFEGGSARHVAIDQAARVIRFMPGGDAARGWPCWWFLRVDGAA